MSPPRCYASGSYLSLFQYGDWLPLKVSGEREENLIVYARVKDGEALIVAVPRLVFCCPHKRNAVGQHFGRHPRRAFRETLPGSVYR